MMRHARGAVRAVVAVLCLVGVARGAGEVAGQGQGAVEGDWCTDGENGGPGMRIFVYEFSPELPFMQFWERARRAERAHLMTSRAQGRQRRRQQQPQLQPQEGLQQHQQQQQQQSQLQLQQPLQQAMSPPRRRKRKKGTATLFCADCELGQFALQLVLHAFFSQTCMRTWDAHEADLFFVPFFSYVQHRMDYRANVSTVHEKAMLDLLERGDTEGWKTHFHITDEWWKRRGGADHMLVMPMPLSSYRHPLRRRGFEHYLVQLWSPIFLSVEVSKPFMDEYPACTAKNILLPYPNIDPARPTISLEAAAMEGGEGIARTELVAWHVGQHGICRPVREAIEAQLPSTTHLATSAMPRTHFHSLYLRAKFCPCPVGDSPSARRMYDVLYAGCVPVVVSDEFVWPFTTDVAPQNASPTPLGDPRRFSLRMSHDEVVTGAASGAMMKRLRNIADDELHSLQREAQRASRGYQYYKDEQIIGALRRARALKPDTTGNVLVDQVAPRGGAIAHTVQALRDRVRNGLEAQAHACAAERRIPSKRTRVPNICVNGTAGYDEDVR